MSKRIHPIITSADVRQDHTPGPWSERDCEIQAADGSPICEMLARPEDKEKWGRHHADANSRLICAAPETVRQRDELLTACEELHSFAVGCAHHVRGRGSRQRAQAMFDRAREAIANAKGGE